MSPDPKAVQELFAHAIEIADAAGREKFLADRCTGNIELYERVARLLAAYERRMGFLDHETKDIAATHTDPITGPQPGCVIAGRYKLLEAIGEGGMGTVWVAEQTQPIRRKVALKLVKPGMDSKQVLARFDAERQALALMDHPNIARVFDGGVTDQGRPFFAMEYVKGMPLTEYCDQMRLPVEERLKLFVPICQAVQHAHQKGIIHRDLKPTNVLICLYDGKPVPKVIDFGLAKAMHQPLTDQTVHTGHGLMIGTPLYMSPEQAEHNNLDVDTRTDVYSLGVMLYELLTGSTPLEKARFKDAAIGEILRLIKEVEPPKPSTRVSSSAELPSIAAQRNLDPSQLGRSIRGDLDWIVMKAIDKERDRRYETANGLARDIERFLNLEEVEACPPTTRYRLSRLARKHRAAIGTAAAFLMILVLGAALSAWQAIRATKAESLASQRLVDVQAEQRKTKEALEASQASERRALDSESLAVAAREAEEQAKTAEAEQRKLAEQQRDEATRLQVEATSKSEELQQLTEQQRRIIYASEMNQVRIEAQRGNLARMREILLKQLPIDGLPDLRGFEWNYWYRYLSPAQELMQVENFQYGQLELGAAVLPGGELAAVTRGDETQVIRLRDKSRVGAFRGRVGLLVDRRRFAATGRSVYGAGASTEAFQPSATKPPLYGDCTVTDPTGEKIVFTYPEQSFQHVSALNISEDGRTIAVLGNDATHEPEKPACRLLVWDVESRELRINQVQSRELNRLEFSPDGRLLGLYVCHGSKRQTDEEREVAVVLDVNSGEEKAVARHNDDIDSLFWVPGEDRCLLATLGFSGANRKQLLTWTISGPGPRLLTSEAMPDYVKGAISPNGKYFAVTSHLVPEIRVFDTERGERIETLVQEGHNFDSLTFSSDGQHLLACSTSGAILRWQLKQARDPFALVGRPLPRPVGYAINAEHKLLTIASSDGAVILRRETGEELVLQAPRPGSGSRSSRLLFSPNSHYLVHQTNLDKNGLPIRSASSSVATQGTQSRSKTGSMIECYDLNTARELWSLSHQEVPVSSARNVLGLGGIMFSDDSRKFVLPDGTAFDCDTGVAQRNLPPNLSTFPFLVRGLDGRILVSGIDNRSPSDFAGWKVVFADALNGEHAGEFRFSSLPQDSQAMNGPGMAIPSPDGVHTAVMRLSNLPTINVGSTLTWEVWNHKKVGKEFEVQAAGVVFSPNGRWLAVPDMHKTERQESSSGLPQISEVSIWDVERGAEQSRISLVGAPAEVVRFSPSGDRLVTLHGWRAASGGSAAYCRLWDLQSGREILVIPVADVNHYTWDFEFDSRGDKFVTLVLGKPSGSGGDGNIVMYDGSPLPQHEDDLLISEKLVERMERETPFPTERSERVSAIAGLKPTVRSLALERINRQSLSTAELAGALAQRFLDRKTSPDQLQRTFRFVEELKRTDATSQRPACVEILALCRTNQAELALQKLEALFESSEQGPSQQEEGDVAKLRFQVAARVCATCFERPDLRDRVHSIISKVIANPKPDVDRGSAIEFSLVIAQMGPEFLMQVTPRAVPAAEIEREYLRRDANRDGAISAAEYEPGLWNSATTFDTDKDGQLDRSEFESAYRAVAAQIATVRNSSRTAPDRVLPLLNRIAEELPDYAECLNGRAWLLATCPDERFRNGEQAVRDATRACKLTQWSSWRYIDTLAAAYAEVGNFQSAVKYQTQAIEDYGHTATPQPGLFERLALYVNRSPCRVDPVDRTLMTHFSIARRFSVPLISDARIGSMERIIGWCSAWSPDGKKLVRNVDFRTLGAGASLSVIDLETGDDVPIYDSGVDPFWSPVPGGPIAFVRAAEGTQRQILTEEIWLIDSDGARPRRVGPGGFPSFDDGGNLYYRAVNEKKWLQLAKQPVESLTGTEFDLENLETILPSGFPTVSPGGDYLALAIAGKLMIQRRETSEILLTIPLAPEEFGLADWSPDGRYLAYGSWDQNFPGVMLVDTRTGEYRLLSRLPGTMPRWSPDGHTLAVDDRETNEIVLIDLKALDLSQSLTNLRPLADSQ